MLLRGLFALLTEMVDVVVSKTILIVGSSPIKSRLFIIIRIKFDVVGLLLNSTV